MASAAIPPTTPPIIGPRLVPPLPLDEFDVPPTTAGWSDVCAETDEVVVTDKIDTDAEPVSINVAELDDVEGDEEAADAEVELGEVLESIDEAKFKIPGEGFKIARC
ncbi:hypothetical protein HDU93_007901 [Gonapodya sp. JEL0774]|nr:hypothetical protein HDU93_007901 [Gonapodya sp. JEL0774]